jgi:P4 family phage/plasmid primase-like protien
MAGGPLNIHDIARHFAATQVSDNSWKALCPAHKDSNASLSITEGKDGKTLLNCLAGCDYRAVLAAVGLSPKDLFAEPPAGARPLPFKYGMTLADYARAKNFDPAILRTWGLHDGSYITRKGQAYPGLAIPYQDAQGNVTALRWRMRMEKEEGQEPSRFLWSKGAKIGLYGLWKLNQTEKTVILVEGESDCHALWAIGANALGVPGASNYRPGRDDPALQFFDRIYVHLEKDQGGQALYDSLSGNGKFKRPSTLHDKLLFFSLPGYKDPCAAWEKLHQKPDEFRRIIGAAIRAAQPAASFERPKEWAKPAAAATAARRDRRALSSPINGAAGGRPKTDYIGLVNDYKTHFTADGHLTLRHWRNAWYHYNGRCYKPRLDVDIENAATAYMQNPQVAEAYHVQPSANALRNLLLGLRSTSNCGIPAETEAPSWLTSGQPASGWMAMQNTLINIEAAAAAHLAAEQSDRPVSAEDIASYTKPLSPDLLSTFSLAYDYDPHADCPRFRAWLQSTQPNIQLQDALLMLMGLALVPDTSYNVCFFLFGEGGTGKSTYLDILAALIGDENVCRVPILKMEDRFSTWPLAENLLNIVGEMPSDDPQGRLRYIEGDFKDSISGGMITVERKGKDICTARCTARHVFATNTLPVFFDKSEGIWDRLVIIPFEQRFRGGGDEIRNIKDTIIPQELPGIFNWALRSLAELRTHTRFPEPDLCQSIKQHHRERCDFDASYLRDFYHAEPDAELPVSACYDHYRAMLLANGLAPRSSPTFQQAVARVYGIRPTKRSRADQTRVFRGLAADYHTDRGAF